jgi:RNase H-like domain found in reverse transcriptase
METDASDYTTTAVLIQEKKPLAFILKKINTAEQNYTIIEKEIIVII